MDSILGYEVGNDLALSLYQVDSGLKSACVKLDGICHLSALYVTESQIWLLAEDQNGVQGLYQWDPSKSPAEDTGSYTHALYTAENPDTQGLEQCRETADALQKKYGVKLLLWQDAVAHADGHTLVAEHKPQVISTKLQDAETVLANFPEKFLLKTVEKELLE